MNLTAVTDEAEVMTRHVADSLAVLPPLERAYTSRGGGDLAGISLIDVGSGAGLPGLILAVARPSEKRSVHVFNGDGIDTAKRLLLLFSSLQIWVGFRLEVYAARVDAEAMHVLGACS